MPKSRLSRIIALLAMLIVALTLAFAHVGDSWGDGGGTNGEGGATRAQIVLHFGW